MVTCCLHFKANKYTLSKKKPTLNSSVDFRRRPSPPESVCINELPLSLFSDVQRKRAKCS